MLVLLVCSKDHQHLVLFSLCLYRHPGTTSDTSRALLVAITAAASSTPERNVQKQLLALSKAVADCVYKVVEACKAAGTSSAEVIAPPFRFVTIC